MEKIKGLKEIAGNKPIAVTGANGFIGSQIVKLLLGNNLMVRALVEPATNLRPLEGLKLEIVEGDLRNYDFISSAFKNISYVIHTGALYKFWHKPIKDFYDVNVIGTINVLRSAKENAVNRIVYTSTVGTIDVSEASFSNPADETKSAKIEHLYGYYKKSKFLAEHEVLKEAAQGADIVLVHPTTPVGEGDYRPTPTGRIVLDYLNGKMIAYSDTSLNIVDVRDVALGHVLALMKAKRGRGYILGSENLKLKNILEILSEMTHLAKPKFRVPSSLVLASGYISEFVEGRLLGKEPLVPLEAAQMAQTNMVFDISRAKKELGFNPRGAREALEFAVKFFLKENMVSPRRQKRITNKVLLG